MLKVGIIDAAIMQDDMHPQRVPVADGANWTRQCRVSVVPLNSRSGTFMAIVTDVF